MLSLKKKQVAEFSASRNAEKEKEKNEKTEAYLVILILG